MNTRLLLCLCALGVSLFVSCTEPQIDPGQALGESCTGRDECAVGLNCDVENALCIESYNDRHGVFKDKLVLGASLATTGGVQDLGKGMLLGMSTYLDHINKTRGGVHGRIIELRVMDDAYDVAKAKQNTEKMIKGANREVFATIGNMGSPTAAVTVPIHNENKVVFFGPYTGSSVTRKDPPDRYIFNFRSSYANEAEVLTNYLLKRREPAVASSNIGVFAQSEIGSNISTWERLDAYGREGFIGASNALKSFNDTEKSAIFLSSYERGTAAVDDSIKQTIRWMASADRTVDRDGVNTTVGIVMQSVANSGTEFVTKLKNELRLVKSNGTSTVGLSEEEIARLKRVNLVLTATSPVGDQMPEVLKQRQDSTNQYCEGLVVSQVVPLPSSASTGVSNYREQLKTYDANATPGFVSLEGYFVARLFVEALEAAGPELTDDILINALEGLSAVDLGIGSNVGFGPNRHQASDKVWGSALDKDCQYVEFEIE